MRYDPALSKLARAMRRRLLVAAVAMAALLMVLALGLSANEWPAWAKLAGSALLIAALGGWTEHWWRRLQGLPLAEHLNRRWPELQDSAQLLLQSPRKTGSLVQRQQQKASQALVQEAKAALPRGAIRSLSVIAGLLLFVLVLPLLLQSLNNFLDTQRLLSPARLVAHHLTVSPPAYTGLPGRTTTSLSMEVPQFALVTWRLQFSARVDEAWLDVDDGKRIAGMAQAPSEFVFEQQLQADQVYQIRWRRGQDTEQTPPALIRVIRDQPPVLTIVAPEFSPQETVDPEFDKPEFVLEARDDYGMNDAVILATVAKGDGEGVKFRDVELAFTETAPAGKAQTLVRRWNLAGLGMQPGDELYFRGRVSDNRLPEAQVSQTQVLMLRWLAPKARQSLALDGIAVDILPEYFRSQRQIIIDTEKLLAEREQLSATEGVRRARRLALDQKSLRIRYGQYLGEEYESDIGFSSASGADLDDSHSEESFSEHLAHAEEAAAEILDSQGGGHNHAESSAPGQTTIGGLPDFMADFVHAHDSAEQATLFDNKTRDTLKAALAQMWQSELYLQLTQPSVALPYEYEALALLKQVQQANRIYVRRAGFEPPALDEGKRLSGDPEDSGNSSAFWNGTGEESNPRVMLERLLMDLQTGEPLAEDLAALSSSISQSETASSARLAVARWKTGSCPLCLQELKAIVWNEVSRAQNKAPANVRRRSSWGAMSEVYLAPLTELP